MEREYEKEQFVKKTLFAALVACAGALCAAETLVSPDGTLRVDVEVEKGLSWSARRKGSALVLP